MKKRSPKDLEYYMSKNYKIEIIKDETEVGYVAQYPELRGCITCAGNIPTVIEMLEDAKREWLIAAIEDGYPIAEPYTSGHYMHYRGYIGTAIFSEEDQVFHGKLIGISDSISYEGDSVIALTEDLHEAVDDYLESCERNGRQPDKPFKSVNVTD